MLKVLGFSGKISYAGIGLILNYLVSAAAESYFKDGAEDDNENFKDFGSPLPLISNEIRKASRQDEADLEVILNPGPMIAPDIIIRQFVDSNVNVDNMMEESGSELNVSDEMDLSHADLPHSDETLSESEEGNEIVGNESPHHEIREKVTLPSSSLDPSSLKVFSGSGPCRKKLSGLSGNFSLNFAEDCVILIATPAKRSRIVLNCTPLILGNCTSSRDALTVNLKGDLKFGRNSYLYCGQNAQVRVSSLKRRMSIRIRKTSVIQGSMECAFHSKQPRELSMEAHQGQMQSSCGHLGRTAKIVGGRRVSPGLFPWVAQLDITRTDGTQTACTGSLVSSEYVLTAAHCLKNAESISVFLGGTDRHEFTGSEVTVQAEKYILHRKWSTRTLTADIALVKLTDAVKYSEDVSPICLPTGRLIREDFEGRKGVAVGWGRVESKKKAPRQLYRVKLPFLSEQKCRRIYRKFFIPKIMVCTDSTEEAAICYGDSGGPLMYKRQDKVYQIGIASFSLSKTCGASPDVFTHVREYVPWIENRIKLGEG